MTRSVEQMQEHLREVSDEELARLIDTVKVKPPPPPALHWLLGLALKTLVTRL